MGTNYEALTTRGECSECQRPGMVIHLCKTSIGWMPMIQLFDPKRDDYWAGTPEADQPPTIQSFEEWKTFLYSDEIVEIRDEYRRTYTPDELVEKLERLAEKVTAAGRQNERRQYGPNHSQPMENGFDGAYGEWS